MRSIFSVVFGLLLCLLASNADAGCVKPSLRWENGDVLTTNWTVDSGTVCTFNIRGKLIANYAVEFPVRPRHGKVGAAERYAIAYRAADGYKGPDQFVFRVIGKQDNKPGAVTVTVNVTVN